MIRNLSKLGININNNTKKKFMKKILIFAFAVIAASFVSCGTKVEASDTVDSVVSDSVEDSVISDSIITDTACVL